MASFGSLDDVDRVLGVLGERGYARRLDRRPGQKEDRFEHLLGAEVGEAAVSPAGGSGADGQGRAGAAGNNLEARVAALEVELSELRRELSALRQDPLRQHP